MDIAAPAYISSLLATEEHIDAILSTNPGLAPTEDLPEAINIWKERTGAEEEPQGASRVKQKSWDTISAKLSAERLLANADQVSRARLQAAARAESGAWLNAIPIPSLGTHLDAETLRIAIAPRVGASVCHPHKCRCGKPSIWNPLDLIEAMASTRMG